MTSFHKEFEASFLTDNCSQVHCFMSKWYLMLNDGGGGGVYFAFTFSLPGKAMAA